MREVQGEHIYRTLIETRDFAVPSEENVGEIHRQIAQKRRSGAAMGQGIMSQAYDAFNVAEALVVGVPPAQAVVHKSDGSPNTVSESQKVQNAINEMQPIIFEEVYVKSIEKIKLMANQHQR